MRLAFALGIALTAPTVALAQPKTAAPTQTAQREPIGAPNGPPLRMYVQPESEEVYDRINAEVFTTGLLVFAATYGASAIVAATSDHAHADRLYLPVVGPWVALHEWGHCPIENPSCDSSTTDKALLITDGVFQAAGVLTMIAAIIEPSRHRVDVRSADRRIHVIPSHDGIAVFGHF